MPQLPSPEAYLEVLVEEDIADMVDEFLENRRKDQKKIVAFLSTETFHTPEELEPVRRIGHSMKGVGGMYGFHWVTAVGAEIDQACREKDLPRLESLTGQLGWYLERVRYRVG